MHRMVVNDIQKLDQDMITTFFKETMLHRKGKAVE